MTTLPLHAAFILVAAAWVAFAAWVRTTYASPARSRKVPPFLFPGAFQLLEPKPAP